MPEATVLIPTFDHGPLIRHALASAQRQSVRDIEIFVVGDGAPPITRETVERMAATDPRIRYFDNPKGEGCGERHRHRALGEAVGRIVCYLSDDDLWFPDHVETMAELLQTADFAGGLQGRFFPDGRMYAQPANIALRPYRNPKTELGIKMGLSVGAHTLAFYRRLPEGWRPAPPGTYSDQHMWQQFFATPGCRAVSSFRPTGIGFTSAQRKHMSLEERAREMEPWDAAIADPARRQQLREAILVANLKSALSDASLYAERL
jgi:glycosyltransferase involved in cell wall biosynthesis